MAEIEFHELRGDYVPNAGQTITLREYLDYFEPLGSALSRLPDGGGGPFVHRFTDSGGRTIGSIGWVVSAASKRYGAWTLWGMWTDQAMPAVALPLFWTSLPDPGRTAELVRRANEDAGRLLQRSHWSDLLDEVSTHRLHDDAFRAALRMELERAWAVPPSHQGAIEVELTPRMLDLLPWLYILGPVDPGEARLQPGRFTGPGYQYILDDHHAPAPAGAAAPFDVEELVDTAASDVMQGWLMAREYRMRRSQPKTARKPLPRPQPAETNEMPEKRTRKPPPAPKWQSVLVQPGTLMDVLNAMFYVAVLALLGWIGLNVHLIRKAVERTAPPAAVAQTAPAGTVEPQAEPEPEQPSRVARIAAALPASLPRGVRVTETVLNEIAQDGPDAEARLARVAVEVFLRRSNCFPRTEAADARLSTAEQRAIRTCTALQNERLMKTASEPDTVRALRWLEQLTAR